MLRSSSARRQYTVQQLNCIFHLYISNLIGNLLKEVRTLMIISSILYINYFIKIVGSLGQACLGRQCGMFILAIIVAGTHFFLLFFFLGFPYYTSRCLPYLFWWHWLQIWSSVFPLFSEPPAIKTNIHLRTWLEIIFTLLIAPHTESLGCS